MLQELVILPRWGTASLDSARTSAAPPQERSLVPAAELVSHAGAHIASQRGKADGVLILLVEEVGSAGVEREATAHIKARRQVESRVAWVFKLGGAGEIAVGATSGEISREIPVHSAPSNVDDQRSRMQRQAKKRIARFESRIGERIGGFENARVVIGIVPAKREPADGMGLHGKIHTAGAGKVSVEIIARAKWTAGSNGARSKTDYIVKAIGEVISGETQPVGAQELLETKVVGAATFGAERGIARIAGIGGERLLEPGFLDALAVGGAQPSVSPK